MVKLLGQPRFPGQQINQRHKDIAYAAQALLEEAALLLTKKVMEKTNSKNLCLAGGVALNCKMNGEILLSGLADEIFIQPISNDAGSSLGAAMIHVISSKVSRPFMAASVSCVSRSRRVPSGR